MISQFQTRKNYLNLDFDATFSVRLAVPLANLTFVRELVALDMPASDHFVDAIKSIWNDGDGFVPIDQRLPHKAKRSLIGSLKPSRVIDWSGAVTKLDESIPLEDDQCLAMATSGTTGTPKIVMFTMDQLEASARATSGYIGVGASDKWLCCIPVAHIGGLSVILRSLLVGNPVEVHNSFDAGEVTDAARRGATLVSLVPTALAEIDPAIFRRIVLGGSKPPSLVPENVMVTYGLTESGSGVVYDGSPLPGLEIEISSRNEIMLKGPMLATRFRNGVSIQDEHGWFHTKDAGRFNNNKLEVFGRMDEVINTGGENVFPAEIESILAVHPKVRQVAVIPLPDSRWGEAVTAVIIPNPDLDPPKLEEIREAIKSVLPPYCAPTRLHIVDEMPTTNLGKIQKHLLKKLFTQKNRL